MKWAGHIARMGIRGMHIGFWWEIEENERAVGRFRRRWEDNIRIHFREIGWCVIDWIHPAQDRDRVEGSCEHGNEPPGSVKCWKNLG
jgi:hypothetical protein